MSNDTMITVQGWLAADPVVRTVAGTTVANFRVGCTPRRFHRGRQEWVDGETQWYSVSAWRALGANCARSLKRGEPVIVHGRLQHRTYVNANQAEVVALEIEAVTVGHDLTRGIDSFLKSPVRQAEGSVDPRATISGSAPATDERNDPFADVAPRRDETPVGGVTAA